MNIHDKINAKALISDFAKYGEADMKALISKLKIRYTGDFENSLRVVGKAASESLTIEVFYNFYGLFVQYGLGKGISMGDQKVARMVGSGRKQKNWMKGIGHMRHRLGELYASEMADGLQQMVADSLQQKIIFKL